MRESEYKHYRTMRDTLLGRLGLAVGEHNPVTKALAQLYAHADADMEDIRRNLMGYPRMVAPYEQEWIERYGLANDAAIAVLSWTEGEDD